MSLENIPDPAGPAPKPPVSQITFHQIKSNFFRVVHSDGAWCSMSPRGLVHLTFFSERQPLPKELVHDLVDATTLGAEDVSKRVTKEGFVREMEVDVVLSRADADGLHKWLGNYLKSTETSTSTETNPQ
ncbi:MAG TPA: hypothetical protein VFQ43_13175 [Nitrososphaera sp.]|nr:hypothetical protein [Nitrososphaera sp.]